MNIQLSQVVQLPMDPSWIIPLFQSGCRIIGLPLLLVEPGHDASHGIDDRIGTNGSGLGTGTIVVGDIVHLPLRVVAPAVIRASDRIALNLFAIPHNHR